MKFGGILVIGGKKWDRSKIRKTLLEIKVVLQDLHKGSNIANSLETLCIGVFTKMFGFIIILSTNTDISL